MSQPEGSAVKPVSQPKGGDCLRIQFIACDVGRGLDLKGQFKRLKAVVAASRFSSKVAIKGEFDVNDENLFAKFTSYLPNVVHISGNQNGGDVLMPSARGGEIVIPDEALAGLLSSLGSGVQLAIIDTCWSYSCAKRVSRVVECAVGVEGAIYDDEATRFYEVFYQAALAGLSIADAHRQAVQALRFKKIPFKRIPRLCVKKGRAPSQIVLVHE
jgi:hypothetical protein